jgi:hypothetical protein
VVRYSGVGGTIVCMDAHMYSPDSEQYVYDSANMSTSRTSLQNRHKCIFKMSAARNVLLKVLNTIKT